MLVFISHFYCHRFGLFLTAKNIADHQIMESIKMLFHLFKQVLPELIDRMRGGRQKGLPAYEGSHQMRRQEQKRRLTMKNLRWQVSQPAEMSCNRGRVLKLMQPFVQATQPVSSNCNPKDVSKVAQHAVIIDFQKMRRIHKKYLSITTLDTNGNEAA